MNKLLLLGCLGVLLGCQEMPASTPDAKVIAVGDSLMAWNGTSGNSIPDVVERSIGEPVLDRSASAAWLQTGFDADGAPDSGVQAQFVPGEWDWAIVNGGGNDLMLGCACMRCSGVINTMISKDGQYGQVPDFLRRIRDGGTQVIYVGYLRSPDLITPIEHCKGEGDEFEARIKRLAQKEAGITFVSVQDVAQPGDPSYFSFDLIHPSRKSSRIIGERIAQVIKQPRS
ncbi:Lysophospholipase L1 [Ruegeria halocynthiae]|uniref:Lysophospholipase L1 n=1 Tax=Ruegeria halocynthiae TaxID=985054 RepID=A0A1H2VF75_9RHOB|nr:SGNH/GDSL hydrolase family protein [Ruegeria halocynthiae]SDW66968.1 Lysophospholipase L1 [Ruegeria halocynthiae]